MLKRIFNTFNVSKNENHDVFKESIENIINYYFKKYDIRKQLDEYLPEYYIDSKKTIEKLDAKKINFVNESLNNLNQQLTIYSSNLLKIEYIDGLIKFLKKDVENLEFTVPLLFYNIALDDKIQNKLSLKYDRIQDLIRPIIDNINIDENERALLVKEILMEVDCENIDRKEISLLFDYRDLVNYLFEFERDKNQLLIENLNELRKNLESGSNKLAILFDSRNIDKIITYFNSRLRAIPYDHFKDANESFYNAILGIIISENQILYIDQKHNNIGRADLIIQRQNIIYCLELKLDKSADEALRQIIEKDYLGEYRIQNKTLIGIGINISSKERQIDFKCQELQ